MYANTGNQKKTTSKRTRGTTYLIAKLNQRKIIPKSKFIQTTVTGKDEAPGHSKRLSLKFNKKHTAVEEEEKRWRTFDEYCLESNEWNETTEKISNLCV